MVALTYSDCDGFTFFEPHMYLILIDFFRSQGCYDVVNQMEKGDIRDIGIKIIEIDDIPYELDIGFQITLRFQDYTYSYSEFKEIFDC